MNYSDISDDIYYNDDFSYLESIDSNEKDKSNLNVQVLCDVDNLYNEAMKKDSENYNKLYNENNRKIEEDINKMFSYNKNYYNQLMEQYKRDVTISLPQKNIDILNSIYRTKYDIGILDNVEYGENVPCNEDQLKAIRNCSSNCSRNECNYENLQVILGFCKIDGVPQSYGETFCLEEQSNCLSIQKQYIESCSKDCYSCDADTSDITLNGCLVNNIPQIYGDTFCSDNNINICSPEQIEYYERCKENCNSCNRIAADTFMSNCTIDGKRPIHSHNYCVNCNLYNSGDPTTCVSLKSLDNKTTCKYIHPGTEAIPASCKLLNNPTAPDYEDFNGTKETCPEEKNYYFIPAVSSSPILPRNENCSKTINCDDFISGNPYSCISVESESEKCVYNIPYTSSVDSSKGIAPMCINSENNEFYDMTCDDRPQSSISSIESYREHIKATESDKYEYYDECGPCVSKSLQEIQENFTDFTTVLGADTGRSLISVFDENNKVYLYGWQGEEGGYKSKISNLTQDAINYPNVTYGAKGVNEIDDWSNPPLITNLGGWSTHTCREIYDHSLGYCPSFFCNLNPLSCPESDGYKYIFGKPDLTGVSNQETCTLVNK